MWLRVIVGHIQTCLFGCPEILHWEFMYRHFANGKNLERNSRPFVMRVFEGDIDGIESEAEEVHERSSVVVKRFTCDELYLRYTNYIAFFAISFCFSVIFSTSSPSKLNLYSSFIKLSK